MYVRTFGASVLALTFAVTTESSQPVSVTSSDGLEPDKVNAATDASRQRIVGPLEAVAPGKIPTLELMTDSRAVGLDFCNVVEVPRGLRDAPAGVGIAFSSDEFFDVALRRYMVKHLFAVSLPENGRSVVLRVQSNQTAPTRGPLEFDYPEGNGFLDKAMVSLDANLSGSGRGTLEVTLMYRYDTRRSPLASASVNYIFPDVVASLSAAARHDFNVDADLRNEERIGLAVWGWLPGSGTESAAKLTATVGLRREGNLAGSRAQESYTLDWGGSVQLSERLSAGINMNYSWNEKGLGMLFFVELKDPPRRLRNILGGLYELGNP